ncbi:uncharacterized protein IL334_005581 [Kwoniella shivajii]|uniref:Uncharacterized protein n=1 Tax=Kwoniella shivajii TaxID=564305 RepID=A0ABZ1D3J3_9TREE|nr:hypothetical protein IL334_005581 [Kwoniella shivajii]
MILASNALHHTAAVACQPVRSFCSTCRILSSSSSNNGESSRLPRTRAGTLASAYASTNVDFPDRESERRQPVARSGQKGLMDDDRGGRTSNPLSDLRRYDRGAKGKGDERPSRIRREVDSNGRHSWKDDVKLNLPINRGLELYHTSNSAIPNSNFNQKTTFIGFDLSTSLPTIFRTKIPVYKSPLFNLRAIPTYLLPPRKPPPFPLEGNQSWKNERRCVYVAAITSKNAVSKLAVERNRSRRRWKAALNVIINSEKSIVGLNQIGRNDLITPEYAYIASVTSELHDAPFDKIQSDILDGLNYIRKSQTRRGVESLSKPKYIPRSKIGEGLVGYDKAVEQFVRCI